MRSPLVGETENREFQILLNEILALDSQIPKNNFRNSYLEIFSYFFRKTIFYEGIKIS